MKVKELIECLKDFSEHDEIYIEYPSNDYQGSVLVRKVEDASRKFVVYSTHHEALKLVDTRREFDDGTEQVIVLE